MTRRVRALAGAPLFAALAVGPAGAVPPLPSPALAASDAEWSGWREQIASARAELDRAWERLEAAEAAVTKMRHRSHPRGETRRAMEAERDAARAAYAEAEEALEEVVEAARRAGLPPGYLDAASGPSPEEATE